MKWRYKIFCVNGNTGFNLESRIFYFIHLQNEEDYKRKEPVVPDEVLGKEFLSQFKTEADVSKFLKQLPAQVLKKMLEGEIGMPIWVMKRILWSVIIVVIHVMAAI